MRAFLREFKVITLLFIFFFGVMFFIIDGGTTFIIMRYNFGQTVSWMKYELTRPPFFLNYVAFSPPKSTIPGEDKTTLVISDSEKSIFSSHLIQFKKLKHQEISNTPSPTITVPPEASQENILVIPKFKIKAPIQTVSKPALWLIYVKLRKGVVLYPGSAIPGKGYSIIIGHSSQYPWRPGNYKRVFSLLTELKKGDKIYVYWQQKPLVFQVEAKKIFLPWPKGTEMTETVFPPDTQPTLILQSCWPVGVAYKRIAVKTVLIK